MVAGEVAGVDPEAWKIVDGKLYLGYSKAGIAKWDKKAASDLKKDIETADEFWARISK